MIAAEKTPWAKAALLAVSAATDGRVEALAGTAAAGMDPGIPEPPWASKAREPMKLFVLDRMADNDDDLITALVVTVGQAGYEGCFFLRFHPGKLLTEKIYIFPQLGRNDLLAEIYAGTGHAYPYRFTRRAAVADTSRTLTSLVCSLLAANEVNLELGGSYPMPLADVPDIGGVTIVPALLVLIRKCLGSRLGFAEWTTVDDRWTRWR